MKFKNAPTKISISDDSEKVTVWTYVDLVFICLNKLPESKVIKLEDQVVRMEIIKKLTLISKKPKGTTELTTDEIERMKVLVDEFKDSWWFMHNDLIEFHNYIGSL
jgi:hypothetical protein